MISLAEVKRESKRLGLGLEAIEKDYVLGWLLKGVSEDEVLSLAIVFKGGTAIRKAYFPDYRFSEDLDFTGIKTLDIPTLNERLKTICKKLYAETGIEFSIAHLEQTRSKEGEEAYEVKIEFIGPRHQQRNPRRIKLDLTFYEKVLLPLYKQRIHHPYSDRFEAEVLVYRLDEILAEKLRTILQRRYPRDIYDLWSVLKFHREELEIEVIWPLFLQKCEFKGVKFTGVQDFIEPRRKTSESQWNSSLRRQLREVPDFNVVEAELGNMIRDLGFSK